jgi:hypothetical protein
MAEAIGTAVARVTGAAPCSANSTSGWDTVDLTVLDGLPARLDDQQLAAVETIAGLPVPPMAPVSDLHFNQCMRTLTVLPSREDDTLTVKLRLALYRKHFGHLPEAAWSFLVENPTPSECKAILDRWTRTDAAWRAYLLAGILARNERQARMDEVMRRFRNGEVGQAEADALPERWRRIAMAQGHLRDDGSVRGLPVGKKQRGAKPRV